MKSCCQQHKKITYLILIYCYTQTHNLYFLLLLFDAKIRIIESKF
nr:MAG TPA: hypothetical protein [Caudoviricetes sp.]